MLQNSISFSLVKIRFPDCSRLVSGPPDAQKHMDKNRSSAHEILHKFLGIVRSETGPDCKIMGYAKDGLVRGILQLKFKKDHLCLTCALGKKKSSHQPKAEDTNQEKLYLLHMDLCGPIHDEAPDAIIKCIKNIQVRLNATVRNVRTYNGTEFVNRMLLKFDENVGISHETSVARTAQQNGIIET
ncbi:retrovirus-related pol polyprotein from transposon TNT 1-94 [Tanacetum coccineum]